MSNNINVPVFEIKDSYIIKHKLNYNTSYDYGDTVDGVFTSYKQRMLFTDYEIARKSQPTNAENFQSIKTYNNLNSDNILVDEINAFSIEYLDYKYTLLLDGNLEDADNEWIKNETVFNYFKPIKSQVFKLNHLSSDDFNIGDTVTVEIYKKKKVRIIQNWEYIAVYSGETFFLNGETEAGTQWIKEIICPNVGYNSGIFDSEDTNTILDISDITPLLKYNSVILDKTVDSLILENKIESYLFNNYSNMDNVFYKIISNNHCEKTYTAIINKLKYFKYYDYFTYKLSNNFLEITPKKNDENIYIYYDKFVIKIGIIDNFIDDSTYMDDKYVANNYNNNYLYYRYTFETQNIYNRYTLNDLMTQFIKDTRIKIIYNEYGITNPIVKTGIDYPNTDVYLYLEVADSTIFNKYTYVRLTTDVNMYNAIIIDIQDNILKLLRPLIYEDTEMILSVYNLGSIKDISYVLEKTFLNYQYREYNKISEDLQKKIYFFYADIINKSITNQDIRLQLSGIIFQNTKNRMVLKVFDPTDFKDKRLTYEPTEITFIGKDKKTSLPLLVNDVLLGISADLLNPNYNTMDDKTINDEVNPITIQYGPLYVLNSNLDEILLVIDANKA